MRGYEVEPGRFAMLEHEEIERARPERSTTIDLEDFVELEHIDPVYFDKAYYVAPGREAAKPYRLLLRTLDRTHRVGIGRFVLRTKPHLVAVRATGDALVVHTLFFGDEVRASSEVVNVPDQAVSDRELRIAEQLVEMFATTWDPERYADEYRQELLRIIAEKTPVESPERPEGMAARESPRVEELMEALKRSVEEAKAGRDQRGPRRRAG
jgi:DNA end-binding protein Ku